MGKCLFGVTRADSGKIEVFGEAVTIRHPADTIRRGLVYLPEERKQEGIFPLLSIRENIAIASLERFQSLLTLRFSDMAREASELVQRIRIKIGGIEDPITSLSGGNQQKVILARWLMRDARILILDEPTRGVDVNAKLEIQAVLQALAARGLSILYISSELQEVLDVSNRVLVMHEGKVKGIADAANATQRITLELGDELEVKESDCERTHRIDPVIAQLLDPAPESVPEVGGQRNSRRPSASRGGAVDRLAELPFAIQSHRRRATGVLRWSRRPRANSRSADWRDRSFRRNGGGILGHCRLSDADEARNPSLSCASPDRPVRVWARTD